MKYITVNHHPSAGIGHQFHVWLTALILSKKYNLKFLHKPFTSKIRNKHNSFSWDKFLNIGSTYDIYTNNHKSVNYHKDFRGDTKVKLLHFENFINTVPNDYCINLNGDCFGGELYKELYEIKDILYNSFWSINNKHTFNNPTVVLHIRRGDIDKNKNKNRWVKNSVYINLIKKLKDRYKKYDFLLISEGDEKHFKDFHDLCELELNNNDLESFLKMCSADILITGKSTFSITSSYFNKNKIFYSELMEFTEWEKNSNYEKY